MTMLPSIIATSAKMICTSFPSRIGTTLACANIHKQYRPVLCNTFHLLHKNVAVSLSSSSSATAKQFVQDSKASDEVVIVKTKVHKHKKKMRRLKGVGSILTDPGVPVPQAMEREELVRYLAQSAVIQGILTIKYMIQGIYKS